MAQLVVGDSECSIHELVGKFEEPSIAATIITDWTSLARRLGTPLHIIEKYRQDLLLRTLTHSDVVEKLLVEWKSRTSNEATLGTFYQKIPDSLKLLKDMLQDKIREQANCWNDLDADSQNVIMQTSVKFLGRIYSLSSIRDMVTANKFKEIINKAKMKEYFLKSFGNEDWDLGHYDIPKPLSYYIYRKLTLKRRLNPEIFKHKCSDIFLIEGIQHHHLSILARPELTDISSDQLNKVTRRFILLEHPDDYNEIIKLTNDPVHKIKLDDNQFFWLSTSGSCQLIRIFLFNDAEEIEESNLVKEKLFTFNNRPLAICSSPGMGKSVLLGNLAHEMIKTYPQRITIYLELRSLIPKLSSIGPKLTSENIKPILVSSSSISWIGKQIMFEFLDKKDLAFEIFLDGFDEISLDFLKPAKHFLKCLLQSPNMRVYITSRPHMKNEIENIFEVISLDIAPFHQIDQSKFLCDYWNLNSRIPNCEKLSRFALKVLKSFEFINENMTSQTEFAGIPLQCFMLAQVYANDAKMYCSRDNFQFKITVSLCKLYEEFVKLKFKNIRKCDRILVKMYHWKEALMLLFPSNQEATQIVQELTRKSGTEEVPWGKIFTVGIMEQAPNSPNFVHRTFAEYLLAEFIVEELLINEVIDFNTTIKFFIESVLFIHETTRGRILSWQAICDIRKFIESSESWKTGKLNPKKLKTVLFSQCDLPFEAAQNDLYPILFNWLVKMGSNATIDRLESALEFLGCSQLLDNLHRNVLQNNRVLQHEMMCTFVEGALEKCDTVLTAKKYSYSEDRSVCLTQDGDQLKWKLLICTEHNYYILTKVLLRFYRDTSILNNVQHMDNEICEKLILRASYHDNVEFFQYICDAVKPFMESNLNDSFKTFLLEDMVVELTPLYESIRRGNYKLVEYLFNYVGDDVKEINELWHACFFESWKDSPNVILNKVKILRQLKTLNYDFQVEKLEQYFPGGVNVVLLTTLYDLCEYVPCENDVEFMSKSISFCCRDESEFDHLAKWLLSKNLVHLLTYFYRKDFCLISEALVRNVVAPETLSMVYTKLHFDLGIIFPQAVSCKRSEAIVKTIVELSTDVNVVDKNKSTLLHWAACYRKLTVIKYLLSTGANVNARNAYGSTPLYNVFQNIDSPENFHSVHDIVVLLFAHKAELCAKNIAGLSALDLAKLNQVQMSIEERTITLLENSVIHNSVIDTHFKTSEAVLKICDEPAWQQIVRDSITAKHFLTFVKNVIHISGNVNLSDTHDLTLLHHAASAGEIEAVEYLLLNGAHANLKDNDGDTPLHCIFVDRLYRNSFKVLISLNTDTKWIHPCVQLLLKYNADVNAGNNKGETPLDLALQEKDKLNIEDRTINLLIEKSQNTKKRRKMETVASEITTIMKI